MTSSDARGAQRKALADSRWRAYCANLGYPDPDAATQERTIWPAGDKQTATSRICSAFRRGTRPVTVWMRQAVDDVYSKGLLRLPEVWSAREKERYLEIVTERLDAKAADLSMELGQLGDPRMEAAQPGTPPRLRDHAATAHGSPAERSRGDRASRALQHGSAEPSRRGSPTPNAAHPGDRVAFAVRQLQIRHRRPVAVASLGLPQVHPYTVSTYPLVISSDTSQVVCLHV
jgi:hypothetical protein